MQPWADLDAPTFPKRSFYQVPTTETGYSIWCFCIQLTGFATLPHFIQRIYAAGSMKSLKAGFAVMTAGPWLTQLVGVYMGTVGVYLLRNAEAPPASPFTAIIENMMEDSGFGYFTGTLVLTSSLAAIMSTADSILIAISQLVSTEVYFPLRPFATPTEVSRVSKLISLAAMALALLVGFTSADGLAEVGAIQFAISFQALPIFVAALFTKGDTDFHPWSLAAGGWAGFVTTFAVYYGYLKDLKADDFYHNPAVAGLYTNVFVLFAFELSLRAISWKNGNGFGALQPANTIGMVSLERSLLRFEWDCPPTERFGAVPLTGELLYKMMKGIYEPPFHAWLLPLVGAISVAMLPLHSGRLPSVADGCFAPNLVSGIPDWAFSMLMWCLFFVGVLMYVIYLLPDDIDAPREDDEADVMPLDLGELTTRSRYDEPNAAVAKSLADPSSVRSRKSKVTAAKPSEVAVATA